MLAEVLKVLDGVRGCKVATVMALNAPVRLKAGHPFTAPVRAMVAKQCLIGVDYSWLVNSRIMLEGIAGKDGSPVTFAAVPSWGDYKRRVDGSLLPYMEHDGPEGPFYLPNCPVTYVATDYRLMDGSGPMGSLIPFATVAPWLPKRSEGGRQPQAVKVPWRKNGLKNVIRIAIGETITEGEAQPILSAIMAGDSATAAELAKRFAPVVRMEEVTG